MHRLAERGKEPDLGKPLAVLGVLGCGTQINAVRQNARTTTSASSTASNEAAQSSATRRSGRSSSSAKALPTQVPDGGKRPISSGRREIPHDMALLGLVLGSISLILLAGHGF